MSPLALPVKLPYRSRSVKDPRTGEESTVYYPAINVVLTGNHRVGRPIEALVDSGADINLFPADYAFAFFKIDKRVFAKGVKKSILGIGGKVVDALGHRVTLKIVGVGIQFKTLVYFSPEHDAIPLLGRKGFFDRFKRVSFDEHGRGLELTPLSSN